MPYAGFAVPLSSVTLTGPRADLIEDFLKGREQRCPLVPAGRWDVNRYAPSPSRSLAARDHGTLRRANHMLPGATGLMGPHWFSCGRDQTMYYRRRLDCDRSA